MPKPLYTDLEHSVRQHGYASFKIGSIPITFDLSNRHERHYSMSLLLNILYPQGDIDQALFRKFVKSGDQVLDGGANIGVTALEMLEAGARRVIAAEPILGLFSRLASLETTEIVAVNMAISATIGSETITISTAHNQGSSLKAEILTMFPSVFGETHQTIQVETTTIDALRTAHGSFDIWKLDIEGAEVDALTGAVETLAQCPPRTIIAELYGDLRHEFSNRLKQTHPYSHRVFLRKTDYELDFADLNDKPVKELHYLTSPMFVFSREPICP